MTAMNTAPTKYIFVYLFSKFHTYWKFVCIKFNGIKLLDGSEKSFAELAELGPDAWRVDVADWLRRAHRGIGVRGRHDSSTAYFWGERSWGGPLVGACFRPRDSGGGGDGGGNEEQGGRGQACEASGSHV